MGLTISTLCTSSIISDRIGVWYQVAFKIIYSLFLLLQVLWIDAISSYGIICI